MTKVTYKRRTMTLDTETIRKCGELDAQHGQSVSSFVRYVIGEAYRASAETKGRQTIPAWIGRK